MERFAKRVNLVLQASVPVPQEVVCVLVSASIFKRVVQTAELAEILVARVNLVLQESVSVPQVLLFALASVSTFNRTIIIVVVAGILAVSTNIAVLALVGPSAVSGKDIVPTFAWT